MTSFKTALIGAALICVATIPASARPAGHASFGGHAEAGARAGVGARGGFGGRAGVGARVGVGVHVAVGARVGFGVVGARGYVGGRLVTYGYYRGVYGYWAPTGLWVACANVVTGYNVWGYPVYGTVCN
jgi:hypothetical protein